MNPINCFLEGYPAPLKNKQANTGFDVKYFGDIGNTMNIMVNNIHPHSIC